MSGSKHRSASQALFAALSLACCAGCMNDMHDQPRHETLEASDFFGDGRSARPLVAGTVARGQLHADDAYFTGKTDAGVPVDELPENPHQKAVGDRREHLKQMLLRGRERFTIYCSVCHGLGGDGDGMIVQRGFRRPPSYHSERLRDAPIGHFFDVVSHGFGVMPSYAVQIEPADRWAIAAYVRVLQLSRNGRLDDVPEADRGKIGEAGKDSETGLAPAKQESPRNLEERSKMKGRGMAEEGRR